MLFDCDPKLIKTLAKEQRVGARDLIIKPKRMGPNEVTFVSAKSMRGVEFTKTLETKITKITLNWDPEDDPNPEDEDIEDEDDEEEDQGDLSDEEELGEEEEEDDLGDEEDEDLD